MSKSEVKKKKRVVGFAVESDFVPVPEEKKVVPAILNPSSKSSKMSL